MGKGKKLGFSIFILLLTIILIAVVISTVCINYIFSSGSTSGRIFGKNVYVVNNADMEPEIEKGSAVIADKDETAVLIEGNVILFRQEKGVENVMRIVQVEHSTVDTVYRVAADAKSDEIIDVNKNDVVAKCTKESHNLGRVITFLKSVPGILAGMILPCLILLVRLVLKIVSVRNRNNEEEAEMFDGGVDFVNNDNDDDDGEHSAEQTGNSNPLFDPSMGVKPDMTFEQKKSSIYENFARKPAAKNNAGKANIQKTESAVEKFRAAVDEKPPAPVTRKASLAPQAADKTEKMAAIKAALNNGEAESEAPSAEQPATASADFGKTASFKIPVKQETKPENKTQPAVQPKNQEHKKQDDIHSIDDLIKALEEEKKKL